MKTLQCLTSAASVLTAVTLVFAAISTVQAAEEQPTKALTVRDVMQQLGRDMQAVTGAIAMEDWKLVAELAPKIADHAEPPLKEKMRVMAWLGTDVPKFRGHDSRVHSAAVTMKEAAERDDGQAVIVAFSRVQQNCLACHQSFRQSFRQHFYGDQ